MSSLKKFRIVSYGHATHPTARVSGEVARCQKTAAARTFLGGVYDFMIMIFRSRRPSAQARGRRPGVLLPGGGSPALRRAGGAALSPPSGRPSRTLRRKKLADTALPVTRRGTGAGAAATWPLSRPTTRPPGRRPEAPAGRIPRFGPEFVIRLLGNSSSYRLDCNPRKPHSENP